MRVTTNLLRQFGNITATDEEIVKLIKEHIGEVDYHHNLEEDYKDIVIAEIKQKESHPDADKLGIYQIDFGDNENIQVVAGDKSLEVGNKVAYLKVGSIVPYSIYTEPEPFVLKAVTLRGVLSNGMLGSERELNVGINHEKVMVLPDDAPIGISFSDYFELNDTVVEIENKALTNRGDLFGILGISRELTAILKKKFESPDWYSIESKNLKPENNCLNIEIVNDAEALCPRYTAIVLDNIEIKQSPLQIKSALIKCGVKPINNVVDVTNYIALLIGQPLHAFDYDKLLTLDPNNKDRAYINIRMAKQGEKLLALDQKIYDLNENTMVIADSTHPIAIAGVIGGKDTEIDESTKRIIIESANFNKSSIRKTSMQLGIFTEAATRFKHDLDTKQCLPGLLKAVELIKGTTDGKIASNIIDIYKEENTPKTIQISEEDLNKTLGTNISISDIKSLLENLEYQVEEKEFLFVTPPSWRRDVEIKEDVYEDIGRIYGFNNIDIKLPTKEINPPKGNKVLRTKRFIREILSNSGANETLTYSFVDNNSFEKCHLNNNLAYKVQNPLSPELSLMRTCILQSLLQKAKENMERGIDKFSIYEFNIAHLNNYLEKDNLPKENWYLSLLLSSSDKYKISGSPYYAAKSYLEKILEKLNLSNIQFDLVSDTTEQDLPLFVKNIITMFDPNTSAIISVKGIIVGILGEIDNSVKNNFKLPRYTAGFEININELANIETKVKEYKEQPVFPSFIQDLCFEMDLNVKYADIKNEIDHIINSNDLWGRVECLDIYKDAKSEEKKRITYRITASNHNKTLKDKDIKEIIEKIKKKVEEKIKAILV